MKEFWGESPLLNQPKQSRCDLALMWIAQYGTIDGDHHKAWVLDQVARILHGAEPVVTLATWSDGTTETRTRIGDAPEGYSEWRKKNHNHSEGIAP